VAQPTGHEERATLELDGQPYEVVALEGEEGISRLFRYEVVCASSEGAAPVASLLAQEATITLRDGSGSERQIRGVVAEAAAGVFDDGGAKLTVVVRPAVIRLTLTRDSYILQDVDVVDIVKDVLAEHQGPVRYEITRSYPERVYCAQYREDDWTFVSRLLEEEGIYYWFDHRGGQTTLVFGDASTAAPDLDGGPRIRFAYESGMTAPGELIQEIGSETKATSTAFTVASFDYRRPSFKVSASVGSGALEIYHARGANPESPAVCEARARTMLEASGAARRTSAGLSSSVRLAPGMVFELHGHPLGRPDGRYLVTEITLRVVQRRRGLTAEEEKPYACRFRAIRAETIYRHPRVSPLAKQAGLQSGVVVGGAQEEVHPDPEGRVRVQLHWDRQGKRDEAAGKWLRVAQRGTASSMLLPRVGWTVLTFNEEGAVDQPNLLSRIFDGEHLPPYSLPGNKTRVVFKTATTPGGGSFNEIYFEDTLGAEEMFINASRDMNVYVQNLKSDYVFNDARRDIGAAHDLSVEGQSLHHVSRNQSASIGSNESIAVASERAKTVTGDEKVSVGGVRSLTTGQGHENQVKGDRTLTVGAALIDTTLGGISALAKNKHTMLVGGAAMKVAGKSMSEDVGTVATQTIGGLKIEQAKEERLLDVRKDYTETIGGVMLLSTSERFIDHANTTSSWVVGGTATMKAPDVWIQAKDRIELRCGSSVIVILPDSVEIRAKKFDLSQAGLLDSDTLVIEHN
jgi:type VI secretion system secreted protein VgrG